MFLQTSFFSPIVRHLRTAAPPGGGWLHRTNCGWKPVLQGKNVLVKKAAPSVMILSILKMPLLALIHFSSEEPRTYTNSFMIDFYVAHQLSSRIQPISIEPGEDNETTLGLFTSFGGIQSPATRSAENSRSHSGLRRKTLCRQVQPH